MGTTRIGMPIGWKQTLAGLAVLAVVIGGIGVWIGRSMPTDTATPKVLHGTVSLVSANGDAFGVDLDGGSRGTSFGLGSVPWLGTGELWHDGGPIDCLKPLSTGQHVRFGVVHVTGTGLGTDLVAWVDCS